MAKANLTLPNGTVVNIEGTPEEVQHLLAVYSDPLAPASARSRASDAQRTSGPQAKVSQAAPNGGDTKVDLVEIVNLVRTCDTSERIESAVLDSTNVLNRVLLPLFIVHEHKANAFGLTSGEVNKILTELGVPITQPHVSTCLSGPAKSYVIGDKMRVKGHAVRYKLNRRGVQYFQQVLKAQSPDS